MPITPIDAAFKSFKHNECYIFVKDKFAIVNYAKKHEILKGPLHIVAGLPFLAGTPFEYGIDCAFNTQNNEAYIFSEDCCSKINYDQHSTNNSHHQAQILTGPKKIASMFTCLRGTAYEHGIDAAIRTHDHMVLLFKGNAYALMDYHTDHVHANHYIRNGFKTLVGTVFENGIDAAFKSDTKDEAYIFKNQYYACINIEYYADPFGGHLLGGRVKRIHDDWSNITALLNCAD
ncbi:unnamed protein product [Trifolium pratense]|uniref:Uncharacterized protein n=1 Tax=Trifolium pratense TaxID=57577 RepID=A0ACB0LFW5_TRIPR|nr:unnamed protein product [Trifolium pratense]